MQDEHATQESEQVRERANLLPEERTAGSADPLGQAHEILEESEERAEQAEDARISQVSIEPPTE